MERVKRKWLLAQQRQKPLQRRWRRFSRVHPSFAGSQGLLVTSDDQARFQYRSWKIFTNASRGLDPCLRWMIRQIFIPSKRGQVAEMSLVCKAIMLKALKIAHAFRQRKRSLG